LPFIPRDLCDREPGNITIAQCFQSLAYRFESLSRVSIILTQSHSGVVHLINVSSGFINIIFDDPTPFWTPSDALSSLSFSLTNLTKDVTPIPCHSHNDYWRRIPLYEALHYGCTGVEADVWLFDNELFVGHSTRDLTINKTLRSMYVDPLVKILDAQNTPPTDFPSTPDATVKNGVFSTDAQQTLVLLVDFKNSGPDIYPVVSAHLSALREKNYLTYYNGNETISGPITVVATGNAPFDLIIANTSYRDIFFDAPLDRLWEEPITSPSTNSKLINHAPLRRGGQGTVGTTPFSTFNGTNSYYASVSFTSSIGHIWWGKLSAHQINLIRGQIQGAKRRGLQARYWGTPTWPVGLRNRVWKVLVEEGVGYLSGDDLKGMTTGDWGWESVS
jgi:hypothetical protein